MKNGHVILVGAGCGRGLITQKGLAAIQKADVILYDDLLDTELLRNGKSGAECIYVGKRSGQHSMRQEEINALLVETAKRGGLIVRLKGGDSFVFGRGGEEAQALLKEGISFELIPGISSAIAVPEHVGIPVTHRKEARSFTVVTGHTANGEEENFEALAALDGTLVFLMGLKNAGHIAEELMRYGKDPKTPAAIISDGFGENEECRRCTLETLGKTAEMAKTPAVIVIGKTAAFSFAGDKINAHPPLRVMVSGSPSFVPKVRAALEREGIEVIEYPSLQVLPTPRNIPADLSKYGWLLFTSANGVRFFFEEMQRRRVDLRSFSGEHFAVIGQGTAEALWEYGICADFVPSEYTAEAFGRELGDLLLKTKDTSCVIALRAKDGSPDLMRELLARGISVEDCGIYETKAADVQLPKGAAPAYLTFGSASGVRAFFKKETLPPDTIPVCIGPAAARELERCTDRAYLMPEVHTAEAMAAVIVRDAGSRHCSE